MHDAAAAERAGAGRVELCADLVRGGTTPSAGVITEVCERVAIPVVVLVRPRAGDFRYDADERRVMARDVATARSLGAHGVAIGALAADGRVDAEVVRALLSLGVDRVLTSGHARTALDGAPTIARLVRRAGDALGVMAGGRVTADVAGEIVRATGVRELHARPSVAVASAMAFRREGVHFGKPYTPDECAWTAVSEAGVRALFDAVPPDKPPDERSS